MLTRQLSAFNTATESTNKIHDDQTARRFGFTGGLVPGVEVHGYLSWGPVRTWGEQWLRSGTMASRYALPTYDGHLVTVTFDEQTGQAQVIDPDGTVCATSTAALRDPDNGPPPDLSKYGQHPAPAGPPPASPESLVARQRLGSLELEFPDEKAATYLDDVREELPIYSESGFAHPGWILGLANSILMHNVTLGPWIHVGSTVQNYAPIAPGTQVSVRGFVEREYEKSGHRFVDLDVVVLANDALASTISHTAIYLPRQVAQHKS